MAKLDQVLKTGAELTLEDVYDNFNDYNFIIYTKMGSIDTSVYNACNMDRNKTIVGQGNKKSLILYRVTPNSDTLQRTGDINITTDYTTYDIERYVEIEENVTYTSGTQRTKKTSQVQSIVVKSVRGDKGFLLNQLKPKKL